MIKSILLSILGIIFPVFYIFIPVIFIVESVFSGIVKIFSAFLGICLILGLILSPQIGIMFLILFGPFILIFHYMISNKYSVESTIMVTAVVFFLSLLVSFYWVGFTPESINSPESIENFIEFQKAALNSAGDSMGISEVELTQIYNMTVQMIPSAVIIMSLVLAYLTYTMASRSIAKRGGSIVQPFKFSFFKIPKGLPLALLLSMVLIYFFKGTLGDYSSVLIRNLVVVFGFILFVLGFSVVVFWVNKMKLGSILKFLIYVSVFLVPGFQLVLIVLGVLDYIFNFRKLLN
ncbi:DUF2232 domain-containing protein [Anaerosphaera multitolerans]|nr:DUF2232 domain-containing protein [Anaerosphaera multitolerans]